MGLLLKMGLRSGSSSRKVGFIVFTGLAMVMLLFFVDRSHRVVLLTPDASFMQKFTSFQSSKTKTVDCKADNSSAARLLCKRYEVYVVFDGNGTGFQRQGQLEYDLLKQILDSSECSLVPFFYLHIVYYRDSGLRSANETTKLINESIYHCGQSGTVLEVDFLEIPDRSLEVSRLNGLLRDGYILRGIDYFSVVFASNFGDNLQRVSLQKFLGAFNKLTPRDVGVIFHQGTLESVGQYFFSRNHFEIFGFFIPTSLPKLGMMAAFFQMVYPENLILSFTKEGAVSERLTVEKKATVALLANDLPQYNDTLNRYLIASASNPCMRCRNTTSRMVISMSLYGSSPRYTMGAIRNAQLLPVIFPGWRLWFYVEKPSADGKTKYGQVPSKVLSRIEDLGAEIVQTDAAALGLAPMLWRFTVMDSEDVDVFTVRDCDSRLTPRDSAVVADWLKTDRIFHCIRDHPSHSNYAVSGGLWGARRKPLQALLGNLRTAMRKYGAGYVEDMNFLGKDVWPKVKDSAFCHDSFSCKKFPSSHPFPINRIGQEHLGQVYNEHSVGRQGDMDILRRVPVNKACNPS